MTALVRASRAMVLCALSLRGAFRSCHTSNLLARCVLPYTHCQLRHALVLLPSAACVCLLQACLCCFPGRCCWQSLVDASAHQVSVLSRVCRLFQTGCNWTCPMALRPGGCSLSMCPRVVAMLSCLPKTGGSQPVPMPDLVRVLKLGSYPLSAYWYELRCATPSASRYPLRSSRCTRQAILSVCQPS